MKNIYIQQEIIFFTKNSFSKKLLCELKDNSSKPVNSAIEKMVEACWNGLLAELLPEICIQVKNKPITIWELAEANNFLVLQLGTMLKPDVYTSIDPYRFIFTQHLN